MTVWLIEAVFSQSDGTFGNFWKSMLGGGNGVVCTLNIDEAELASADWNIGHKY